MTKIMAKSDGGGSGFTPVSEGLHQAICVGVIDLGVQAGSDRYPNPKHKVYLKFAAVDEPVEWEKDGVKHKGPAIVGARYTLTLSEKGNLRPLLESWRGRKFSETELDGFDIAALAGKPCQIQVLHEQRAGKTYATISSIVPWPKGVPVPKLDDPPVVYSPSEHDPAVYNDLPQWLRETIDKRLANNYEELDAKRGPSPATEAMHDGNFDDDIPF